DSMSQLHVGDEAGMIDPDLNDRVVLVTGGNSGIGAEIVRTFAAQRARVAIHYLESAPSVDDSGVSIEHEIPGRAAAEEMLAEVRALGGEAVLVAADLSVAEEVPRLFDGAEKLGPVGILVNNAAHAEGPDDLLN